MAQFSDTTEHGTGLDIGLLARLTARIADVSGPRLEIVAPFDDRVFASVPTAVPDDIPGIVAKARRAQEAWASTSLRERSKVFSRFHDLLLDRADAALDILQVEAGKSRVAAFEEVFDTVATTRYYLNTAPGLLGRKRRATSIPGMTTAYEYRHPHGVVTNISPWNFPFTLAVSDVIPALLAGNAVIGKPDEKTPFSLLYAATLLDEAGLPEDLLQVVPGRGEDLGEPLIDESDFVMFTGSTAVGRLVAEQAGRRLIGSSMELGGKNAAIVLGDANLDAAVPGIARAVFANGGQLCIAMERIYVEEAVYARFAERFIEHTRGLRMTKNLDFSSALSSMITRDHMEAVHAHVEDAVSKGAAVLTGGEPRPDVGPYFYAPTVLADVTEDMLACRGETFGPVVSLYPVKDAEEAVSKANDSDFGLNHSVWTQSKRRGLEIATRLRAGTVGVNDGYAAAWSSYGAPMGGMKASGLGRRHGDVGILKYTEAQTVAVQNIGSAFAPIGGMGYDTYKRTLAVALKVLKRMPFYK